MGELAIVAVAGAIKALAELGVACINAKSPELKAAESAVWLAVITRFLRVTKLGEELPAGKAWPGEQALGDATGEP